MVCELTVPGDPQSKGRPRVYQGHGITPTRTREAENRVYSEWRSRYPNLPPYEGPVCLALTFWTATRRGRDWDNLAKLFTDALNGAWQESASRNVKLSALFAILVPETPQVLHLNDTSNRTVRGLVSDVSHSEESTFLMEMDVTSPVCPSVPQK